MKKIIINEKQLDLLIKQKDYNKINKIPSYNNPLTIAMINNVVIEGLIKTYPIDKTIQYIRDYFDLEEWDVYKHKSENGYDRIAFNAYIYGDNLDIISNAMDYCGYFLAYPKKDIIEQHYGENITLIFEPKFQYDVSKELRKNEKYLIHVTPTYNIEKIKRFGLSPKSKNKLFNFPHRVYFFIGSFDKKQLLNMIKQLCYANNNIHDNGEYSILTIDLKQIDENVPFYSDQNLKNAVFTSNNIHPNCIINIENIKLEL